MSFLAQRRECTSAHEQRIAEQSEYEDEVLTVLEAGALGAHLAIEVHILSSCFSQLELLISFSNYCGVS